MQEFERTFLLAWGSVLSKAKLLIAFASLALSGLLVVFCSAISVDASPLVNLSLKFLPLFASTGIFLGAGVLISKIHYHERKGLKLSLGRLLLGSVDLVIGTTYLGLPSFLIYLILWTLMGLICFLQQLPLIGPIFQVFFSFAPFLILAVTLCLAFLSLALLFWVAPIAAKGAIKRLNLIKEVSSLILKKPLFSIFSFFIGCFPLLFAAAILWLAASLTDHSVIYSHDPRLKPLEWLFMMLPFAALLSPFLVFFFQYATISSETLEPAR